MNIIEALDNPAVFAPLFRDRSTWAAWRAFLAALFALPMTDTQLATYQECSARVEPPTTQATEAWLVVGRRGGKSFTLALIAVFLAAFRDWRPFLGPGERATVMVIAQNRRQARVILRFIKGILSGVPMLAASIETLRQETIDLNTSVTIEVHSANFRAVRGYTIVAALLDEIAFWQGEDSANPDFEIINAIKPAMATVPGSMLLCASSPYARKGALWEAYHRYFGQAGGPLVWQAPTRTMNPCLPQSHIDAEYDKDPVSAAAEYGAEFRTDLEAYISREAVEACVDCGVFERGPLADHHYLGFVDVSGGGADSFALAITHKEGDTATLDCRREVRPPLSPEAVIAEFADLLKTYNITKVTGDRYGGEFPREHFRRNGIQYEPSPEPKGALYLGLLPLLNSGKVRLLDDKKLIAQLLGLERNTSRGGKDSIDHARGGHDDVANAAAGALLLATAKRPQARVGAIDFARTGRITWRDEEPDRPRLRIVTITEKEDLKQRGIL